MSYSAPTVDNFKLQFNRDFPYGTDKTSVMDSDISKAIYQAGLVINEYLFSDETSFQFAYNYLAAHFLVSNLRASSQGINGAYSWIESSKSVGSVSQSFVIPEYILKNPVFAMYAKTEYGAYYLSLILPLAVGQVYAVEGATSP